MKTLNNPAHPKWSGSRNKIVHKLLKRAERTARANQLNPCFKAKREK